MYIYYNELNEVAFISSQKSEGNFIEINEEYYREIEKELIDKFERYKVDLENNCVYFDEELSKNIDDKRYNLLLEINKKEIEYSALLIENEFIRRQLNMPITLENKDFWQDRIEKTFVNNSQIEKLKELNII